MNGTLLIWQLIKIVCGFVLSVIACGLFLSWGLFQPNHPNSDPLAFAAMIGASAITASSIGAAAFVPASITIALSEFTRLHGFVFHVAAGGGIAFLLWSLDGAAEATIRPGSVVALAAGFVGGAVYWVIAGRTAGRWRGPGGLESTGKNGRSGS